MKRSGRRSRKIGGCAAFLALLGAPSALPARAQTPPPPSPATTPPLGPGDPLPPLKLNYLQGSAEAQGNLLVITNGGITFGDVNLQADRIEFDQTTLRIAARGHVVLTRGDETVRGDTFVFDPENAEYVAENAVAVSPPFYVAGARIERTTTGLRATDARVSPCPDGSSDLRITAREVELVNDRYLVLRRPTFWLFGARILTLPRYRYLVRRSTERNEYALSVPIRIRSSRISGLVIGTSLPFDLGAGYEGTAALDLPSKRPIQYAVTVRRNLLPHEAVERPRGLFADPTRRNADEAPATPLRRFLQARPLPPPPDAVLDFEDILMTPNPVSLPTQSVARALSVEANLFANREIGDKRTADLLLSRLPELRVFGQQPLARTVPADNAAARTYLRTPRPVLTGDVSVGRYIERELGSDAPDSRQSRFAATVGVGTLPLLIGDNVLVRPELRLTHQSYSGGGSYEVAELSLAAEVVLGYRTGVGASYTRRFTGGGTPFVFDRIETQNEARLRGQIALGGGKYTLGLLGRYDVDQQQFFDFEAALSMRLRCIEPRLSYRRLSQQFGVTIVLPGIMQ